FDKTAERQAISATALRSGHAKSRENSQGSFLHRQRDSWFHFVRRDPRVDHHCRYTRHRPSSRSASTYCRHSNLPRREANNRSAVRCYLSSWNTRTRRKEEESPSPEARRQKRREPAGEAASLYQLRV